LQDEVRAGRIIMAKKQENLTGVWHGLYSYPVELEPVYFVATLIDAGSSLHGMTHEAVVGRFGAPLEMHASLSGSRDGHAVIFTKTYDGQRGEGFQHPVRYDGALNGDLTEIEGRWFIAGDWSGRFLMIRSSGADEKAVRTVYEKA
jgi:hypothetical protein